MAAKKTVNDKVEAGNPAETVEERGYEVTDPEVFKPKVLPLVINPGKKGWANEAQATFAATLNGYAYKNPDKWAQKKEALLAQLDALAENPEHLNILIGGNSNVKIVDKLHEDKANELNT